MSQPISTDPILRPKTIESATVTELRKLLVDAYAVAGELRDQIALLSDTNADLRKDNAALRADLHDTRHDLRHAMAELNKRDDSGYGPHGSDFVG